MLSSPQFGIHWATWASVPCRAGGDDLLGLLVSLPSRRLTGDYLAIVTLFFGQIFVTLTTQGYRLSFFGIGGSHNITGGPDRHYERRSVPHLRASTDAGAAIYLWVALGAFAVVAVALTS